MPQITAGVSGTNRVIKQVFAGVSGTNREIRDGYAGVSGVNRPIFANAIDLTIIGGAEDTGCQSRIRGNTSNPHRPYVYLSVGEKAAATAYKDIRGIEVLNEYGLEGAAEDNEDGIKKERINGKEYYTRVVYLASATSTWIDGRKTKVYSTDAPQGTIFVAENNSPLETVQENGAICYLVDTSRQRNTNLNSNGSEYYGTFKVCLPVDNVPVEGSFTIKATGGVAQYNLFLAYNPAASEQSYIISDPGYTTLDAQIPFKWSGTEETDTASLQVIKAGAGGAPLEGAEFTLTGDGGTTVTGTTDRNGQIVWRDLPADEKYTLTETAAPEGYQIVAPMNVTLTPGRTEYLTVTDDVEHGFTIKKVDAQNKGSLQGAVFRFEQIDGSYMTTGTTGFDGTISFQGNELPYGSYRVTEQTPPQGYVKSSRVETVEWDGTKDVTIVWENVRDISLTILKVDEQTGVSLPNATFDVFADGKLITSVTTNDNGVARVTGIQKEAYIEVVETAAPAGYVLDKTPHGMERETAAMKYRAAPGTAMTGDGDNDTPVQSQSERDSVFQREAVAGNESSRQRTCRG